MKALRLLLILLIGGGLGLLAVPLLPRQAQDWVTTWQRKVPGLADQVQEAFRSRSTRDVGTPSATATKVSRGTSAPTPTPSPITSDAVQLERLVHDLVNKERQSRGITPLRQDQRLSAIARAHSEDMADRDFFAHENLLGQDPSERAARQRYICRKDYGTYYTEGVAENIFQNWLYSSTTYVGPIPIKNYSSAEQIAASTVRGWMESPGHRQNILSRDYDRVGTGVGVSKDGKVYIAQNFC